MPYPFHRSLSQAIIKLILLSLIAATLAGLIPPPLVRNVLPPLADLLPDNPVALAAPGGVPPAAPLTNALNALIPSANSGQVTGVVFRDFNSNGIMNTTSDTTNPAIDSGVASIIVKVYDAAGAQVGVSATAADGSYTISDVTDGALYRVEFSNLPTGYESSLHSSGTGITSGTSVQFVTGGTGTVTPACRAASRATWGIARPDRPRRKRVSCPSSRGYAPQRFVVLSSSTEKLGVVLIIAAPFT